MHPVSVLARSGEAAKSGPMGLAVILILCVACYFLFKSMSKHLRNVREDFPAQGPAPAQPGSTAAQRMAAQTVPVVAPVELRKDPDQPVVPPPA